MSDKRIWVEHAADMVRAIRIMESVTRRINVDSGVSDLEFMVPSSVEIRLGGMPTGYSLELEDGVWYIRVKDEE